MPTCKILLVEDDDEWAELVGYMLTSAHYRPFRAARGEEAIALAAKLLPDLAVIDIALPDISGHELCVKLRAIRGLERLPIVVLSGHKPEKLRSLEIGADAFVSKVTGRSELLPTLRALLRRVQMDTGVLVRGDLKLDPRGNAVFLDEKLAATLTRNEFLFFYAVVKSSPEPVSSERMRNEVLHHEGIPEESRSLEMLVARTRKRLGRLLAGRVRGSRRFGWIYLPEPQAKSHLQAEKAPAQG